jgi:prephenate dehydrogenase
VSDLTGILGAKPLFFDPAEHDGLMAAVDHLPTFLSLSLLDTLVHQPTWRELRKVAGAPFEAATQLAGADPAALVELLTSNRDNVVRSIDAFSASLAALRQSLAEGETEELSQRIDEAVEGWLKWHHDRETGQWEGVSGVEMPEKPNVLADAFLGGWWRKRRKAEE